MASISTKLSLVFFLSAISIQAALGGFLCEDLPTDVCAFSVSSAGKRCLLETMPGKDGTTEYQCRTSEVVVQGVSELIETDQCVKSCGIDRNSVGISSDSLLEPKFMAKLCAPPCYQKCPNIVELYFNLAAGEGVFLPDLCERQRTNPHRAMLELLSSGDAAPAPAGNLAPEPSGDWWSVPPSGAYGPSSAESPTYFDQSPAESPIYFDISPAPAPL